MRTAIFYVLFFITLFQSFMIGRNVPMKMEYPAIDSRLALYLDEFIIEAEKRNILINKKMIGVFAFSDLPNNVAGFCNSAGENWEKLGIEQTAVVLISSDYIHAVKNTDDYTFKALVFHELGHCLLYRPHDDKKYFTIMSSLPIDTYLLPYAAMSERYKKEWDEQLDDLFLRPSGTAPSTGYLLHGILENILQWQPVAPLSLPNN